jgi:predicted HAD superfamily Cof-like phosphohydrolase
MGMSQFKELITIELIKSIGMLRSLSDRDNNTRNPEFDWAETTAERITNLFNSQYVPFVSEVEEFNTTMGKPNNYNPVIPDKKEWDFVYNFVLEELEEYKHACEKGDIIEVLDALCDIAYVSIGNGAMLHGLKDKLWPAYQEVQKSNMSKACINEEEAQATVKLRSKEQGCDCHYEKVGNYFIVYRSHDRKVMKNINYFRPNLKQFFTEEELKNGNGNGNG